MPKRRAPATTTTATASTPAYKRVKSTAATTTAAASTEIGAQGKGDDGNPFWEIGGRLRRVGVSEFKGKHLVSIREYYEKDGKMLPGKRGISLSVEELNNLVSTLPQIEKHLADKGVVVERPEYGAAIPTTTATTEEDEEGEEDEPVSEEEVEDEEDTSEEEVQKKKKGGRKSKP